LVLTPGLALALALVLAPALGLALGLALVLALALALGLALMALILALTPVELVAPVELTALLAGAAVAGLARSVHLPETEMFSSRKIRKILPRRGFLCRNFRST
jgi:hypothetical protein